jgi:hypothetical protein
LPQQAQGHLNHSHPDDHLKISNALFQASLTTFDVGDIYPDPPESGLDPSKRLLFPEIQGLKLHKGFRCEHCSKVLVSKLAMTTHHQEVHKRIPIPKDWPPCYLQQFHPRRAQTMFEVSCRANPASTPTIVEDIIRDMHEMILSVKATAGQGTRRKVTVIDPWLLTCKWHIHVAPYDVSELRARVEMPKDDEFPGMKELVQLYFERATALIDHTDDLTLQYLNTANPDKRLVAYNGRLNVYSPFFSGCSGIVNQPLKKFLGDQTLTQYINPVICLLAMMLRPTVVYDIPVPVDLEDALNNLRTAVPTDDEDESLATLHETLVQLWMTKWKPTSDNPMPCPTIRALALLSLLPDGRHRDAKGTTGFFSKFERAIRLTCLWEIKALSQRLYGGDDEQARIHVSPWFVEKSYSTFGAISSLQHRASAIAFATMSMPLVWWLDRENWTSMLFRGHHVDIGQLRQIFVDMETTYVKQWEEEVLCGLQLRVEYGSIADDLSNKTVGYSFLSDPRNPWFQDIDKLSRAILEDPVLKHRFTTPKANGTGVHWHQPALRRWLTQYAKHSGLSLTRLEMLSGGPGRGSEFVCLLMANIETHMRSFFAMGKFIAALRAYVKTSSIAGHDRSIPHAVDALTADLMIQDLVIARPFARFAASVCYPGCPDVMDLYDAHLFVNGDREFNSNDITRIMKELTYPILGFDVGIRNFRHIYIAFERKRCGTIGKLILDSERDTVQAAQAGHNVRNDNRIYAVSGDNLDGYAEDVMPLFCEASTEWQVEVRVVPGERSYRRLVKL